LNEPDVNDLPAVLRRYDTELPQGQARQLERYCQLLWDWNQKLNLTRHTDYDTFVSRDLLDTLQLSQLLQPGEKILDVGTGGGVPGIVLAILRPDVEVSLCESVTKKSRALDAMTRELELTTPLHNARAEDVLEDLRFDTLVARAVGPLWKMCFWFQSHWHDFGRLLAVKGPRWVEERREARERGLLNGVRLRKAATYHMPGTHSESVILTLSAADCQGG
jgi:16S rRNA (guanine527-N7)-methyltransferase